MTNETNRRLSRWFHCLPVFLLACGWIFSAKAADLNAVASADSQKILILNEAHQTVGQIDAGFLVRERLLLSADSRYAYASSARGQVGKYDLTARRRVATAIVGKRTANIALSSDGKWLMAGNSEPHSLVILHASDLSLFREILVDDRQGNSSAVAAVYAAPLRQSFIVALKDFEQVWELSWDPDADPIYASFMHSFRKGHVEGVIVEAQPFGRRRIQLKTRLEDFIFDPAYAEVIGRIPGTNKGAAYNLDARRKVADLDLDATPNFSAGLTWEREDKIYMAVPHQGGGAVSIVDMDKWRRIKTIPTAGPGRFIADDRNPDNLVLLIQSGPDKGLRQMIDKDTLLIVETIPAAKN
jgi:hypothetical protein